MAIEPQWRDSKVPAVTLIFWITKILATTLGETAGDTVSMSMDLGYLVSTAIFIVPLLLLIAAQIRAKGFHPLLYWATIIASTTAGTTLADFATRSIGIGYLGGSMLLLSLVLASLLLWRLVEGQIASDAIISWRAELFYWMTITFSQTLGTALGDWVADGSGETPPGLGMGYGGAALLFGGALLVVALLRYGRRISPVLLFWVAFILTRPLGAVVGDFLDKPLDHGGLALSRPLASLALLIAIGALLWLFPQRAGAHPGKDLRA